MKPILGMEAYVAGEKGRPGPDRARSAATSSCSPKNAEGWANLRYLSSMAFTEGFYYDPRIDKELLRDHSKGLIGLTACLAGEVPRLARQGDMDGARRAALRVQGDLRAGLLLPGGAVERDARSSWR